jgi:hypothetical protein
MMNWDVRQIIPLIIMSINQIIVISVPEILEDLFHVSIVDYSQMGGYF